MWSLVTDELTTSLRRSPAVKAVAKQVEQAVGRGELSAVEASVEILDAFKADFAPPL